MRRAPEGVEKHLAWLDCRSCLVSGLTQVMPRFTNCCGTPSWPPRLPLQVKALKNGQSVQKPIYNHVTGALDPPEEITPPKILIVEGLHPFFDDRVNDLIDFRIYLDISDATKFAWKIQRDMEERGHSLESIKASIESRKPDFDAYIDPQKAKADVIIQVG